MNNQVIIRALDLRIRLLEQAFQTTDQRDTTNLYLLQVELGLAYKQRMEAVSND